MVAILQQLLIKKDDLTTSVKTGDEVEFEYLGILSVITITTFIYFKKKIA